MPARKSQHGRIVAELGLAIVAGELAPGDRLPAEGVLLERYAVSRPVLREAVRVLAAKGLVLSKQRAGAIVRPREAWHLLDPDVLRWLVQVRPRQEFLAALMEVRRIVEPATAALAALAATDAQLREIEAAYAGMEAASTVEELLEPDLAFHRRIAAATNNDLLAHIGNMLSLALRESILLDSREPRAHSLQRHRAILTALRRRDAPAAREATLAQLQDTGERQERQAGEGAAFRTATSAAAASTGAPARCRAR